MDKFVSQSKEWMSKSSINYNLEVNENEHKLTFRADGNVSFYINYADQEDGKLVGLLKSVKGFIIEVIPRGKSFGSARIRTQNSYVTVDHSNHVAKELTQQRGCKELSLHSSPFYFLRAGHQPQPRGSRYRSQRPAQALPNYRCHQ